MSRPLPNVVRRRHFLALSLGRPLAAAIAVVLALGAAAADAPKSKPKMSRAAGKVKAKAKPRTRAILDGKAAKFDNGGPDVGRSDAAQAATIRGEVANTDIFKNVLSVRSGRQAVRDYTVTDATKIVRKTEDKPDTPLVFDAIKVGDAVEVSSKDGRTADEIGIRAAAR